MPPSPGSLATFCTPHQLRLAAALLGSFLAACGGGGGGGGGAGAPPAPPVPPSFPVGGSLSNLAAGTSLTLVNNGTDALVLRADGRFNFGTQLASGASYAVRVDVQPAGQLCSVARGQGSVSAAVSDIAVTCQSVPAAGLRIGGSVSGLAGNGSVLALRLNNDVLSDLEIAVNGPFRFNTVLSSGSAYSVQLRTLPAGQQCTVGNASGVVSADVSNIEVVCSAAPTAPSGGVQGMAGSWLNGLCTATGDGRSTRRLWRVTRQSDLAAAVSESTANYANANCAGSYTPGAFQPASLASVRRTASSATTTATWTHWQPAAGPTVSTVWHWRGQELCLARGDIGSAADPELALPTAAAVEAYFATVPGSSAACFRRE